jgi:hypothetical protein
VTCARIVVSSTALVVALGALAACGPPQKGAASPNADDGTAIGYDRSRCDDKKMRIVRLTTRGDGRPDIWKFYAATVESGTKLDVLVCKQVDLNHDGRVDVVAYYDATGNVVKEEIDLDFDSKFDETVFYEAGRVLRKELDRNHDGRPDVWSYYENDKLVRIEKDTQFRGRVDCWEYYEAGKLDRIGWDTTGSGRVDRWARAPDEPDEEGAAARPAPPPPPPPAAKK